MKQYGDEEWMKRWCLGRGKGGPKMYQAKSAENQVQWGKGGSKN